MFTKALIKLCLLCLICLNQTQTVDAKKYKKAKQYHVEEEEETGFEDLAILRDQFMAFGFILFGIWIIVCLTRRLFCFLSQNVNYETMGLFFALYVSTYCYMSNKVLFDDIHLNIQDLMRCRTMGDWWIVSSTLLFQFGQLISFGLKDLLLIGSTGLGLWNVHTAQTQTGPTPKAKPE